MKQWLTSPGSSCIECSRLFPFSCSTFSKSSFCYEQALGQRHQSQSQCIRVQHTVIPARMPSMENNTRVSLFVTELYLRNRVSDHHVSAFSRPTGLRLSHGESMFQLPSLLLNASVLLCGTRNLTISAYLCWHLAARSMTSQYSASQQIPILYTVSGTHYFQSFDIFYQHLALHVNHYVYARAARS